MTKNVFSTGKRPCYDGGEADDAATTDGGRPAVAGAGGELHGKTQVINKKLLSVLLLISKKKTKFKSN